MDGLLQDLRYAVRSLARNPGLLLMAALSLAIGVAANSTIFSAVDGFLLRPLPYQDPDRLMIVWTTNERRGWTEASTSVPDFMDWRASARTIELAAHYGGSVTLSGGEQPERLEATFVTWNLFNVLGVTPALGRTFRVDEEPAGANNAVILSNRLWQRRYAADPGLVGQTVVVEGVPRAVVGIMPEDFSFPDRSIDIWLPFAQTGQEARESRYAGVIGRIRPNTTLDGARTELAGIAQRLATVYPLQNEGIGTRIVHLKDAYFDETFWTAAMICTVAVGFVLLIACANIANLLLARAAARDREMAVRTVLGAERWKILRQLLTESMTLALAGGTLGLVLSVWGIRWIKSLFPPYFQLAERIGLDVRVMAFTFGVTILAGLLFGLAPALQAARPDLSVSLRESGGRGSTIGGRRGRFRAGLVISEIGLALSLLIAAGLLIRSYIGMQMAPLGFTSDNVFTARLSLTESKYPDSLAVATFNRRLLERLSAVNGFVAVGATTVLPMNGGTGTYYSLPGDAPVDPNQRRVAQFRGITPGYVEAMGMRLVRGRAFDERDRVGSLPVMIVNESFARLHWSEGEALGQRVELSTGPREIVGVVNDTRDFGPDDEPPPVMYLPALQRAYRDLSWAVLTDMDPAAAAARIRSEIAALDPELPLFRLSTMNDIITIYIGGDIVMVKLLSVFAAIALVLAVLGVYGVMAYNVTQRTQEMGIRMALGAQRADIVRMIVRQAAMLAGIGLLGGLAVALGTARFLSAFLHGVSPFDLATFVSVPLALGTAAVVAAIIPARRATRIDPVDALRYE